MEDAFKFGCNSILQRFPDITDYLIPVLKNKPKSKINIPSDYESIQVGIHSFAYSSKELDYHLDIMLRLIHHFENRKLVKGTWEEVKQEIKDFLTQTTKSGDRYDFHIPLHSSLVFFVGRMLDPKFGAEINIYQPSPQLELWILSKKYEIKKEKIWLLEEFEIRNRGSELAAAVSVTHNVLGDVEYYVKIKTRIYLI